MRATKKRDLHYRFFFHWCILSHPCESFSWWIYHFYAFVSFVVAHRREILWRCGVSGGETLSNNVEYNYHDDLDIPQSSRLISSIVALSGGGP